MGIKRKDSGPFSRETKSDPIPLPKLGGLGESR